MTGSAEMDRDGELSRRLTAVRERIASACLAAGRTSATVTLVAVTKTFPAADVVRIAALGVRDVGESRDQEARGKQADVADLELRWHFIGRLQTNKCRSVASYAAAVHSVDRAAVATALAAGAERAERTLDVLVQVDLEDGADPQRGGVSPAGLAALTAQVTVTPTLRLRGLSAVAPRGLDAAGTARAFDRLAALSAAVRERYPQADWLSAGMSADFEAALAAGATHVRIGSALFGGRSGPLG